MHRSSLLLLLFFAVSFGTTAQKVSLADLQGSWYFHTYFVDSVLFADAERATPFPMREYEGMKEQARLMGVQLPDSAKYAEIIRQNDENYRHYRLVFNSDSTYSTELAAGMSKWLPVNGRLKYSNIDGRLHMVDAFNSPTTTAIEIRADELHLSLASPMFFGADTPIMNRELVFRRQQP
jgi:hypothetical protein